jgi:hypothetical protein
MIVYKNPQRQWLAGAEQELAQRLQERAALDRRVEELQQIIQALRPLLRDADETVNASLPQLCLRVLNSTGGAFQSVPQIKEGLKAIGVEIPAKNPLAVLHTTLSRLTNNGYAEARSPRPGSPLQYRITTAGRLLLQSY